MGRVGRALDVLRPAPHVISVAGTNGKGSTIAIMDAVLSAHGLRTGRFTSPHLRRYNERIVVAGAEAADATLVEAFETIETARGATPLTYFEFNALAAFKIFQDARVDVALLEVGLGGRLDAVNVVDADIAVVTSIGLDHQQWLGDTRREIAREKAGIFRPRRPAICGATPPPQTLVSVARERSARLLLRNRDFRALRRRKSWTWECKQERIARLPWPGIPGPHQLANAACAIMAMRCLGEPVRPDTSALRAGIASAHVFARAQRIGESPAVWLDVAHNPAAVRAFLRALPPYVGTTVAVYGALADKDFAGCIAAARDHVDEWYVLQLDSPRAADRAEVASAAAAIAGNRRMRTFDELEGALRAAVRTVGSDGRVLIFGSFVLAGEVLNLVDTHPDVFGAHGYNAPSATPR